MTTKEQNPETISTESQSTADADIVTSELIDEVTSINHVEVIQTVIVSLAQDDSAMVSSSDGGSLWKFKYGRVEVFVQLTGLSDEDNFKVWAYLLQLPAKNEEQLMRKLLQMNWSDTFEAHFGIVDDRVVVLSTRTLADLSAGEVSRAVTVVATIADNNKEALTSHYS